MLSKTESSYSLVSCGHAIDEQQIVIADPEHSTRCLPNQIGEIWVSGPQVAQGYWKKPQETALTFQAYLKESNDGPFLRTGDLGFFCQGELFLTGRLKDVIIIRGRNLYPQDIEAVAEQSHPALYQGSCAAFSLAQGETERLVIVQEVQRHYDMWNIQEIVQSICQAVTKEFDVEVYAVELLRTGSILKTSSGKIQRWACRQGFLDGSLQAVHRWTRDGQDHDAALYDAQEMTNVFQQKSTDSTSPSPTAQEIAAWLTVRLAKQAHLDPSQIDIQAPLVQYGLDSLAVVGISGDLEQWLGRRLSPTLAYDYPSIESLVRYLAGQTLSTAHSQVQSAGPPSEHDAIAVIGLGCRFPGAASPEAFWHLLQEVQFTPLHLPLVCNLTGQVIPAGDVLDSSYWCKQARATVQFAVGIQTLAQQGCETFLEVGPHPTLTSLGKRCLPDMRGLWLSSLHRKQDNWDTLLNSVATFYRHGGQVDWQGFDQYYQQRRVSLLPTYPFERERYWCLATTSSSFWANSSQRNRTTQARAIWVRRNYWPTLNNFLQNR